MLTITELSKILEVSKERTKQLVDEVIATNPSFSVEKGNVWLLGPDITKHILIARGKSIPQKRIVTIKAMKGGIGGTIATVNSAVWASKIFKVLLIDLDPESCASNMLCEGIDLTQSKVMYDVYKENLNLEQAIIHSKYPNLDIIPSALRNHKAERILTNQNPRKLIKEKIEKLTTPYNLIFIDLPPSFSVLVGSAYLASDLIVLPCTPSIFSLESVALTIESIDKLAEEFDCGGKNYKILMNQYNSKRIASQEILSALLQNYKNLVFPFYIRESAEVLNTVNAGKSVYELKGSKDIKEDFSNLALSTMGI